jgi:signal transduction histidine kinase/DNA-binding response OmpR family regulator
MSKAVANQDEEDAQASEIEALFSEAIEALDDGFAIYDSEFRVLYANDQARTDFKEWYEVIEAGGTLKDAMHASLISITKYTAEDDLDALAVAAVDMLLSGEPLKTAMPDGRTLLITQRPMRGGRWVGTSIDMTDELVRQQELKDAKKEAEAASRAKSQFLANMSHEIRTPLNAVLGFASLLKDTDLDERQTDYVEPVAESGESLLSILNDVLDVSKIEAGALDLDETEVNIERLIRSVMALMSVRAQSKDLEIASYVDPNIPVSLIGDQGRIRQILVNLIGNAIKFTEEGGISLEVRLEDRLPGDKVAVLFSVSDTGMGISPEQQAQLFERFTQADVSTTREFGGTGLGLSICHDLVELMEGKLEVQSDVGKGSTFKARIVLAADDGDERYLDASDAQALRGRRLLVVDDNAVNLRVIGLMLAAYGCRVETVEDPLKARDAILAAQEKGKPFETVIIDHMMPGMDGVQLAAQLREDAGVDPVKLILSSSGIATASQAEEWGFDAIAPKPISQRRLINTLNRFFEDLPTAKKATKVTKKPEQPAPPKKPSGDGVGCRILLADDNPTNLKFIQSALEGHPMTIDTVGDGREAVTAARSLPYDLVLMDVQMVHMDGIEATKRIRKLGGDIASVPIIAITASAMAGDRERCLDAGMNDYLAKPVAIDQLLDKIRYWTEDAVREA